MNQAFPDIGFKHLNAIVSLARFGSFIAAASHLGLSQPGLTRIIQQAEKKLNATLFVRGQRSLSLTPAGQEFLPFAEHALDEFIRQTEGLQARHTLPETRLTISSLMSISHLVLPTTLMAFRKPYPQVAVEICEGVGNAVDEDIRNSRVDFGIGNVDGHPSSMIVESVMEEVLYALLPKDHPLTRSDLLRLADLKEVPMISMPIESGLRRLIDSEAMKAGVQLSHSIITKQFSSMLSFVSNGLGVAIAPASVLHPFDDDRFVARALYPAITRNIGVIHLAERPLGMAAESFLRTLRPVLKNAISRL